MKENNPIDQIIEKISLVDFIGRYIPVKKTGKNYMAVCPFHNDRGPSLSISDEKGLFHCFGCGKSGNVITFLMEYENIPFKEALEQLAREAGVALRERPKNEARDRLYRLNEEAADFFFDTLMTSDEARQARLYLKERKVSRNIIEAFRLGYAPASGNHLCRKLKEKGAAMEEMDKLFLAREGKSGSYDLFRDRIMFPICDPGGNVIAFGGRALQKEQQPKYLNSGETPLFKKSQTLYGLHLTRREIFASRSAVVVEGYMDLLALYQYGIKNVVAVLGTAFTRGHAELLTNRVDDITLFFDNDEAGQRATIRSLEQLFNTGINTWVVVNSLEKDPDDTVKMRGKGFIDRLIKNSVPGFDFYVDYFTAGADMDNPEQKAGVYKKLKEDFTRLADEERRSFFLQALDVRFGRKIGVSLEKRGKRRKKATFKGDFRKDEVLFLLYFLEKRDFSMKLAELQDDWEYFITDRRIFEALARAGEALSQGEIIHGRGKYEHFVEDPLLINEMTTLIFREAFIPDEEMFERFYHNVIQTIKMEKKKEEILEKELE
ncbi:MAG TPA: DNA primase [Candidatus Mcinerneyibacteriales bacterium]|nr:DNA primase [Candidatus Mcinerneyibacteriales bacterium]